MEPVTVIFEGRNMITYKPSGEPVEVPTPILDKRVEIVSGRQESSKRALASEILRYVAQGREESQ